MILPQFMSQPAFSARAADSGAVAVMQWVVWKSRIAQQSEVK